ncbi:MAG: type IX secretion system membrane protein PorP/SprF [Bacteroidota bacterium]
MNFKKRYLVLLLFIFQNSFSQEGVAVYSDYLSDNYYLIHPSMAGAANCTKLRLTARKQWFGQEDAPQLQTASFNGRISDKSGAGIIVFNDRNGYHSQTGVKLTYAYHLLFSRDEIDLNQLSFGISTALIQSRLDETDFLASADYDPVIDGTVVQKDSYINFDIGASYNYLDFYAHLTVKNAVETRRDIYTEYENDNLRKLIFSAGYTFGDSEKLLWEPSIMFQSISQTKESSIDGNLKVYKNLEMGKLWGGLSYRRSFDGAQYASDSGVTTQKYGSLSALVGLNYKNFMVAYTYTKLFGEVKFTNAPFHQITLGLNLFCKPEKYHCNCPAVN